MGHYAVVIVQNDFLHDIKEDPKFGDTLHSAICEHSVYRDRRGDHRFTVVSVDHADVQKTIVTGGYQGIVMDATNNGGKIPTPMSWASIVAWLTHLADKFGYRLVKKFVSEGKIRL